MNFAEVNSKKIPNPDAIQAFQNFQNSVSHLNPLAQAFQVPALPQPSQNQHKKLFVGNLPANTGLNEVLDLFRQFGRVNEQLSTVKDDNYAFIHYYSERDAELAQRALNDSYFKNRYIRVQYSTSTGHIKKTKRKYLIITQLCFIEIFNSILSYLHFLAHFEFVDEFKSVRFACQNSVSMANLNHINSQTPLSTISQFGNKFPASCSMHDLNFQQGSAARRPITGRSIQKSSTSQAGFSNVSSSYSSQSLLIPASSQINIQNQLQQLYQLQLLEQRRQMLETRFKAESGELKEYRLFRQNSTNLFDLENEVPGPVGSHLVKSNTISNFM